MTELMRIEFLDMMVFTETRNGLTALATRHYLNQQFYGLPEEERKRRFKTNVANNYLYASNQAMIETSIIGLAETLKREVKRQPIGITFRDEEELRKHRILVAHPASIKFSDSEVQNFYDERKQYKDPTSVRMWRVRSQILDKLKELGSDQGQKFPNKVYVQNGTIELVVGALNLSIQDSETKFTAEEITESIYPYFQKYEESIKRFATTG